MTPRYYGNGPSDTTHSPLRTHSHAHRGAHFRTRAPRRLSVFFPSGPLHLKCVRRQSGTLPCSEPFCPPLLTLPLRRGPPLRNCTRFSSCTLTAQVTEPLNSHWSPRWSAPQKSRRTHLCALLLLSSGAHFYMCVCVCGGVCVCVCLFANFCFQWSFPLLYWEGADRLCVSDHPASFFHESINLRFQRDRTHQKKPPKLTLLPPRSYSLEHTQTPRNLSAHCFHLLSFKRFLGNVVWERGGRKKKGEAWHFFGTPLCPSCPERGGYHGISGHLIKQTIVGACVCVCVCVCVCAWVCTCVCLCVCVPHWVAWQQPLGTTSTGKRLKSCRGGSASLPCYIYMNSPPSSQSDLFSNHTHAHTHTWKSVSILQRIKKKKKKKKRKERESNCFSDHDLSSSNTNATCCQRLANQRWSGRVFLVQRCVQPFTEAWKSPRNMHRMLKEWPPQLEKWARNLK